MTLRVSAPGKLMISGEYVVLDGAEALVASVGARLVATAAPADEAGGSDTGSDRSAGAADVSSDRASLPPEASLTRQHAERALGQVPMQLSIDASALRSGGRKLGLGSSAAAAAAAAAAVLAWHGRDPATARRDILRWALAGHRAVAPQGSGADVAAATLGGVVRFRREAAEEAEPVAWPDALSVVVVWTGEPARTSDLVAKVRALAGQDPAAYREATAPLRGAAAALAGAIAAADAAEAVRAAGAHGRAAGLLGQRAGADILTEPLARAARLAEGFGGAAKPSGAGGGDVALAFFDDAGAAQDYRAACPERGLTPLPLAIGAEGVRRE